MRSFNVILLAVCQALAMSVSPVVILVGSIISVDLAPRPTLATLPVTLMVVGVAVSTIPAALLMRKIGRRYGFMIGAGIAGIACLLAAYALIAESFALFCLSALLIGTNSAFIQQYRFAASESVGPELASRAVSFVLVGGIVAGYLGPELAKISRDWLDQADFSGSFLLMAAILCLVIVLQSLLRPQISTRGEIKGYERSLRQIILQPGYIIALLIGTVSFGVMSFIMTATPIEMHTVHHYSLDQTAWVIQSHIIAMYLPSLFTGFLLERLGVLRVVLAGIACMLGCVFLGVISQDVLHYWGALVLLGVGWNFMFIGSTVILTHNYFPPERFKAQAVNDFTIFGIQALTSLSAATVIFQSNWDILVLLNLPALFMVIGLILLYRNRMLPAAALTSAD